MAGLLVFEIAHIFLAEHFYMAFREARFPISLWIVVLVIDRQPVGFDLVFSNLLARTRKASRVPALLPGQTVRISLPIRYRAGCVGLFCRGTALRGFKEDHILRLVHLSQGSSPWPIRALFLIDHASHFSADSCKVLAISILTSLPLLALLLLVAIAWIPTVESWPA